MIELCNFSKSYDKNSFAVKNINLKAEKGKITGLLGLNGAGKTTVIKAVCGNHFATSGKIFVTDKENTLVDSEKDIEKLKINTGYLPEALNFPQKLTVEEYLLLLKKQFDVTPENYLKTLNLCGLTEVKSKKISNLSKGYKQRLGFAQALIHNPENLILDEPINGLDPAQIIQMRSLIKEISKDKTILISTHLMQEVVALCDKIYILNKGAIAAEGSVEEILSKSSSKNIEEAFLKITGSDYDKIS